METLDSAPPPHTPPLLTDEQITVLAHQGHLEFRLPHSLLVLYERFVTASARFFEQPSDVKTEEYPAADFSTIGYVHVKDEKEYISFHHATRPEYDQVEHLARQVWQQTATLLHRALEDLARGMGLPYGAWDMVLDGCLCMPSSSEEATPTLLRSFHYFPNPGMAEKHSDLGLLTLCFGLGNGLQVLARGEDGPKSLRWMHVEGPTLLIGQILRTMSGNRLRTVATQSCWQSRR